LSFNINYYFNYYLIITYLLMFKNAKNIGNKLNKLNTQIQLYYLKTTNFCDGDNKRKIVSNIINNMFDVFN